MINTQPPISCTSLFHHKHGNNRLSICAVMISSLMTLVSLTACDLQHQTEPTKNHTSNTRSVEAQSSANDDDDTIDKMSLSLSNLQASLISDSDGSDTTAPAPEQLISINHVDDKKAMSHQDDEAYNQSSVANFADSSPMIADAHMVGGLGATLIGDYQGMFPCDDCDSIQVKLNLYADGSTLKSSTHQSTDYTPPPLIQSGHYTQDHDIITLSFDGTDGISQIEHYVIDDNQLILLNTQSEHADSYIVNPDYVLSRY